MTQHPPQEEPDDAFTDPKPDPDVPESDQMLHRLGTPLTIINGYVQLLRRRNRMKSGQDAVAMETSLAAIEGAVNRMKAIVDEHRRSLDEAEEDEETDPRSEDDQTP